MFRNDYKKYCTIEVDDALNILTNVYSGLSFIKDMARPANIHDKEFAEMCKIYLYMYENKWPFVKFNTKAENATEDVTQMLRVLLSERLKEDLILLIERAATNKVYIKRNKDITNDTTHLHIFVEKEINVITEGHIKIQLNRGKFEEDYRGFYEVEDIKVSLNIGNDSEIFTVNKYSDILTEVENYIKGLSLI